MQTEVVRPFMRVRGVNSNSAAFPARAPSKTGPVQGLGAADAVLIRISTEGGGGEAPGGLMLVFFGTGADNDAFDVKVIGYHRVGSGDWSMVVPFTLASLRVTLGQAQGISGGEVDSSQRMADTISILSEPTETADVTRTGTLTLYSPADNSVAWVIVPTIGAASYELVFADTIGTPTKNALVSPM